MKTLMTSTLALAVAAPVAMAQSENGGMDGQDQAVQPPYDTAQSVRTGEAPDMSEPAQLIRTRDITGGNVYTTNQADDEGWDPEFAYDAVEAAWNRIGTIEDVVLNETGQVAGIVAEVGGFLDVGDKRVMLDTEDTNFIAVDDMQYAYVTRLNEEDLEDMPGVDEGYWN